MQMATPANWPLIHDGDYLYADIEILSTHIGAGLGGLRIRADRRWLSWFASALRTREGQHLH